MTDPDNDIPEHITVVCPTCNARMHPHPKYAGKKIKCPDCFVGVRVPTLEEARTQHKPRTLRTAKNLKPYKLNAPAETKHVKLDYLMAQAEIREEPPPPPPRWTFFSGVFTFPWKKDVIVRWLFLSLGCTAVGLVGAIILLLSKSIGGYIGIVLAFFALPVIWLSIWTFSYAAACCLAVIEDTAAGNDKITSWPDPNWRDWAARLIYLSYLGMVVGVVAYGVGQLAGMLSGQYLWPMAASFFLLYPFVLLSSLETNSPWQPVSLPILKSLLVLWWGWLLFYVEAALIAVVWLGPVVLGGLRFPLLTALLTGPILAAVMLICARLLGRLAWRVVKALG